MDRELCLVLWLWHWATHDHSSSSPPGEIPRPLIKMKSSVWILAGRKRNTHWQEKACDTQNLKGKCGSSRSENYYFTKNRVSVWTVFRKRGDVVFEIQKFTAKFLFKKKSHQSIVIVVLWQFLKAALKYWFKKIFYYGNYKHTQKLRRKYLSPVRTWFKVLFVCLFVLLKNSYKYSYIGNNVNV